MIFVVGTTSISGNPGHSTSIDFRCSSGAGCSSTTMPYGLWKVSIISVGDIVFSGQCNIGPANTDADYYYQLVTGRDIRMSGNPQENSAACSGSPSCDYPAPSGIDYRGGVYAAHEQIKISGNPNIFGFMVAEDAIDCSAEVVNPTTVSGSPNLFYDCDHPPSPWASDVPTHRLNWQEVR